MNKNYLYGYLFTFNHNTGLWYAFTSENKDKYFNEGKSEYSAKNIDYIIECLAVKNIKNKLEQSNLEIDTNEY